MASSLPEVEEVLTWGTDVTFRVRKKIFAIGGEGSEGVSIKATIERQADLLALDSADVQELGLRRSLRLGERPSRPRRRRPAT